MYSVHVHLLCTYVHSLTCRDAKLNVNHTGVHIEQNVGVFPDVAVSELWAVSGPKLPG